MKCPENVAQVTENVFISGTSAISVTSELQAAGITHVLKLYFDEPSWPEGFVVREHPLDDGVFMDANTLEHGLAFVRDAIAAGHRVLVVCGLGISRSSTFVLAHLLEQGHDLRDAYRLLRSVRPQAWPMRALWQSLIARYGAPYTPEEIESWRTEDLPYDPSPSARESDA